MQILKIAEESTSQKFRLQHIKEPVNYFIKEIDQFELMSKKRKKICKTLNYVEHFLILASAVTGCIPISVFASFLGIPIGITSSTVGLKICVITAKTKMYKSIINKKKEAW